jgi:DNA-binding response OmpR family regulator
MTTILIADDMPDIVSLLGSRFRALGYTVLEARDGMEALEQARQKPPDIIVLDVMMPELNGFQVCRQIKSDAKLARVPIILLTAKDSEADQFWGAEVGADLYLTKPIEPANVVMHVQELLKAPRRE